MLCGREKFHSTLDWGTSMKIIPPAARKKKYNSTFHGDRRTDDYAWLKDENWHSIINNPSRLKPDIREYLVAENVYTDQIMSDTEQLQSNIYKELRSRIKENDVTVPVIDGGYSYYQRYEEGGEHPIYCQKENETGIEAILLDGNEEAQGREFFDIGFCHYSPNHKLVAFGVDVKGSEKFSVRVREIETGEEVIARLENVGSDLVWLPDSKSFLYVCVDQNHRPASIWQYFLAGADEKHKKLYEETNPQYFLEMSLTEDRRFIVINSYDHVTSEISLLNTGHPENGLSLIFPRETGTKYIVSTHLEHLIALTNCDGAEDFKIIQAPINKDDFTRSSDLVPHKSGRLILKMQLFQKFLVRLEYWNALPRIIIREWETGEELELEVSGEAYSLELNITSQYFSNTLRFSYSSPSTPTEIFDFDMHTRLKTIRKTQEIPCGYNKKDYSTRRLFAQADDGELIPVTLLYRNDIPRDGSAPLLLYAYGAYGLDVPASFSAKRISLIDRGFIFAIAHVRGGMAKGYRWYKEGKLDKKHNTFSDFISAANMLIKRGFTRYGYITAHGGSAGGMLIGVTLNQKPDILKAAIAEVPFVDVLNTMCDASLPLTPIEWKEWGDPINKKADYFRLRGYSPYENVRQKNYPNILVTAGLTDPRVTYWEPAKWVAKLRAFKRDRNILILKTNMAAGHSGAAGRFDQLKETAFNYAFLLKIYGKMKEGDCC